MNQLALEWRYLTHQTPWDSGITPPEVMAFLAEHAPGRALDVGCGTGTNVITLAKHGWRVTGIDVSFLAIRAARTKIRASGVEARVFRTDIRRSLELGGTFGLVLDIGCSHSLDTAGRSAYALNLRRWVNSGGWFLLYSFLAGDEPAGRWPAVEAVRAAYEPAFDLAQVEHGEFRGQSSAWFTFERRRA